MKIGLGLYPHLMKPENYRFAKQAGATHIVAHLPGYSKRVQRPVPPEQVWTYEELRDLRAAMNAEGVELAAIENFEPEHWHDVLLDGPKRDEQMAGLKTIIRNMGKAGIPVMGYNFSYAGVWGRASGPWARGGAKSVGYVEELAPPQDLIPYKKHGFDGVFIPDHTPGLECAAPWHAGMAYALGWMRCAISMI